MKYGFVGRDKTERFEIYCIFGISDDKACC